MEGWIVQEHSSVRNDVMTKLFDSNSITRKVTFTVPHVLIKYENGNGFPILTLRQGGSRQVDATITTDWYDAPVDESLNVFNVKAQNQINVGSNRVYVLNDNITGDKPIAASCPTASEYMSNVGKTVMTSFNCSLITGKNTYRVIRSTIILP